MSGAFNQHDCRQEMEDVRVYPDRKDSMLNAQSLGRYPAKRIYKWVQHAHVHQMLGAVIIVAHASEIMRVVEHIKIWHILAAMLLFAIWLSSERDHDAELA